MEGSYRQFCPVAMASEVICSRWTLLVVRELVSGSVRFNDLRRGLPRISPALLSKRLKELETAGIIERRAARGETGGGEYHLTAAGRELRPVVEVIGMWGQKWVDTQATLQNLDPSLLMWDMRRNLDPSPMPARRVVIQFLYPDLPQADRHWWLIVAPDEAVDLCHVEPGFDVDLYVTTDLRTMTAIWMGLTSVAEAREAGRLTLAGDGQLETHMQAWLGLSPFAVQGKATPELSAGL